MTKNERRIALIDKKYYGSLTADEKHELAQLQLEAAKEMAHFNNRMLQYAIDASRKAVQAAERKAGQ